VKVAFLKGDRMKAKKYWILAGIVILVCAGGLLAASKLKDVVEQRDVLVGLQGVCVRVETLINEAKDVGSMNELTQTDIELKLRRAGIKVLSREEQLAAKWTPCLYINVNTLKWKDGGIIGFSIAVSLNERVFLERDPNILTIAETWSVNNVRGAGSDNRKGVRESVKDLVDKFINDYLAANPKDEQKQ